MSVILLSVHISGIGTIHKWYVILVLATFEFNLIQCMGGIVVEHWAPM